MMEKNINIILSLISLGFLAACSVTPEYVKPDSKIVQDINKEVSKNFYHAEGIWTDATPADSTPKGDWWQIFGDAELESLLKQCEEKNPNLLAAFQTVEMAMAKSRVTEGVLYPQADAHGSYARTGLSENERGGPATFDSWRTGFGLTWDLDFFGRVRSLLGSDTAEAQAIMASYQNTLLLLQVEVANTYYTIRQFNSELELLKKTVGLRKSQVDYVSKRQNSLDTVLDLRRAEQLLYEAQAQYQAVQLNHALACDYLALLVGATPAELETTKLNIAEIVPLPPKALPSELLQRRPDIAAAERRVFAANQRIGAARAAFFPTIALTASTDLASSDIDTLLNSSSFAWGVSPKIYLPIFQGGQLMAKEEIALAEHKQQVELYRAQVLKAIREVEDSLAKIKHLSEEYVHRNKSSESARELVDLTRKRYESGFDDYFQVTDAQRVSLLNDRELIRLKAERFRASISLVAALGGGWYNTPDFESADKRGAIEEVLALPSEVFPSVNPNNQ